MMRAAAICLLLVGCGSAPGASEFKSATDAAWLELPDGCAADAGPAGECLGQELVEVTCASSSQLFFFAHCWPVDWATGDGGAGAQVFCCTP
jgi:hypothetical protein